MATNKKSTIDSRKSRNPRNPITQLFKDLTRVFSGPIVNYKAQTPRALRRRQLDQYQSKFRSLAGHKFKRSEYNPFQRLYSTLASNANRAERYNDFDQMEFNPELATGLDIYADEITNSTYLKPLLEVECSNTEIKDVIHSLFYDILSIESNAFGWARNLCKYGDLFLYMDVDETLGIKSVIGIPSQEIERIEGEDESNPNYVQFQWNSAGMSFERWQVAHFRILGNDKYAPYGQSVLEPARRIFRQLTMIEDAMMAYRVVRAPERRVYYIDLQGINPNDAEQAFQDTVTSMKRNEIVEPETGRVDLRYNPLGIEEDIYIPVRGDSKTRVESLPGGSYVGDIDDVKYLRDKLLTAIKIPPAYISAMASSEGGGDEGTSLVQKDLRFARTVTRIQRSMIEEMTKMAIVHLFTLGYRGKDLKSFTLKMNNPSKIAELQEMEHWKAKFEVAGMASEGFFSKRWMATKIFGLSEKDFYRNLREIQSDRAFEMELEQRAAAADNMSMGDAMPGAPAPIGGDPQNIPGGQAPMAFDTNAPADSAESSPLLAVPGRRDDNTYTTPGAKGKMYTPVKVDKRPSGAATRHIKSMWSDEKSGTSRRSKTLGMDKMSSFARGISENKRSRRINYSDSNVDYFIDDLEGANVNIINEDIEQGILDLEKDLKTLTSEE